MPKQVRLSLFFSTIITMTNNTANLKARELFLDFAIKTYLKQFYIVNHFSSHFCKEKYHSHAFLNRLPCH